MSRNDELFARAQQSIPAGVNSPVRAFRSVGGTPRFFKQSDDPNGFIFQVWAGHRNPRVPQPQPTREPSVSVSASSATITLPCPPGTSSVSCTASATRSVDLTANATDPDNDTLLYTWSVTGGQLTGEARTVTWDLSTAQP